MSAIAKTNGKSRTGGRKVARLYHFEPATVANIEFLATLFGGKENFIYLHDKFLNSIDG